MSSLAETLQARPPEEVASLLLALLPVLERTRGEFGPEQLEVEGSYELGTLRAKVRPGSEPRLGPYQAPEIGWGHAGAASVVYLVCALLYTSLSGEAPYPDVEPEALQVRKLLESPPTLPPSPQAQLAAFVHRGMAPRVEDRPTLLELRGALGAPTAMLPGAPPPPLAAPPMPAPARSAPAPLAAPAPLPAPPPVAAPPPITQAAPPITRAPAPVRSRLPLALTGCGAVLLLGAALCLGLAGVLVAVDMRSELDAGPIPLLIAGLATVLILIGGLSFAGGGLWTLLDRLSPGVATSYDKSSKSSTFNDNLSHPGPSHPFDEGSIAADAPDPGFRPFEIGAYRCFGRLGEGGMGVVYKARHMSLGRLAAVKVLAPRVATQPLNLAWFKREARLAARISHPNVVSVYDFGDLSSSLHFIAMEYVRGEPLTGRIRPRGLPLPEIGALVSQIGAGLDAAHAAGVIHRDLKPDNVLVQDRREGPHVTLVDFGIARQGGEASQATAAIVVGTAPYMSPEQARGEPDLDARTDIFALGVLCYELLTGNLPFGERDERFVRALMERARLSEPPPPARRMRPELSPAADRVLARALSPEREHRHPSAGAMASELIRALNV